MHCIVLQFVVMASELRKCVAVRCIVVQCGAAWCSVLQRGAACYSVLQRGAAWCNVAQCVEITSDLAMSVALCCSVLHLAPV